MKVYCFNVNSKSMSVEILKKTAKLSSKQDVNGVNIMSLYTNDLKTFEYDRFTGGKLSVYMFLSLCLMPVEACPLQLRASIYSQTPPRQTASTLSSGLLRSLKQSHAEMSFKQLSVSNQGLLKKDD